MQTSRYKKKQKYSCSSKLLLIAIALLTSMCNKSDEIDTIRINEFKEAKEVYTKDAEWINPYRLSGMLQIDSFLILTNSKGNNVFQIYNTNTRSLILEYGKFGKGAYEFLLPRICNYFERKNNTIYFYVPDENRRLIHTIDLYKMINGENCFVESLPLTNKLGIQTHLLKVDDLVVGCTDSKEGNCFTYNIKEKGLVMWPLYPTLPVATTYNEYEKYILYSRLFLYNKRMGILIGASTALNELTYFSWDGKPIRTIMLPTLNKELPRENFLDESFDYITGIAEGKDGIYISYYDIYDKVLMKNYKGIINVISWDGRPLKQFRIKNTSIVAFVVDDINNKIYGYAPEQSQFSIVEIDL